MSDNNIYFAAKEAERLVNDLTSKSESWYAKVKDSGYLSKIRRSYAAYLGMYWNSSGHSISFTGDNEELVQLAVNHYRNIASHMLVNITSTRPAFSARSVNSDYKSMAQANLAEGLLDYYLREKRLEKYLYTAVEYAIALSAGFVLMEWSSTEGQLVDYDEELKTSIYEGDVVFSNLSPLDVITDVTKEKFEDNDWVIIRTFKNKYGLMNKYPDLAKKIAGVKSKSEELITLTSSLNGTENTDDVVVYTFMHKRNDALPQGRFLQFVGDNITLVDTPLPYKDIPLYRVTAADILGTPFGYTPMFDLLPIQDSVNTLYSSALTNNVAFGVQNIFVKRGSDLSMESISGGLNILEANEAPQPLNLTHTAPELFNMINMLIKDMETISGVNSVARGNPQDSLKSGTSLALVQSQAIQFMSGLQQQYVRLIEDCGTGLLNILKSYAKTTRVANIVGKSNKSYLKEFVGSDLNSINRVVVDFGNPMSRSVAGKVQMAEQMLQYGAIKDSRDFISIINTGQIESSIEGLNSELLLIKSENEQMLDGKSVQALAIDEHLKHIEKHKALLADPSLRANNQYAMNVLNHIQEHIHLLQTTDPNLLLVTNQTPLPNPNFPPQQQNMGQGMNNPQAQGSELAPVPTQQQPRLPKGFEGSPLTPQDNMQQKGMVGQ